MDGMGLGLGLGWDGSPGGRGYRAPYGANNASLVWLELKKSCSLSCECRWILGYRSHLPWKFSCLDLLHQPLAHWSQCKGVFWTKAASCWIGKEGDTNNSKTHFLFHFFCLFSIYFEPFGFVSQVLEYAIPTIQYPKSIHKIELLWWGG